MSDLIDRQLVLKAIDEYERLSAVSQTVRNMTSLRKIVEQLPSAQPEPCGDVVSRNAIVQILNEMDRYVSTELRLCDTDKKFPQNEVFIVDDVYEEIVEQMPSAQADSKELSFTRNALDTISRQAAIDVLEERLQANGYSNVALVSEFNRSIGYLMRLPSAQPEIVRCKDCKFYTEMRTDLKTGICSLACRHLGDDGFCSEAERRADG